MAQVGRLTPLQIALAKEESNAKQEARRAGGRWWLNQVYYGGTILPALPVNRPQVTGGGLQDANAVAEKVRSVALKNAAARNEAAQATLSAPLAVKTSADLLADAPQEGNAMEIARLESLYQKVERVTDTIVEEEGPSSNKTVISAFREAIASFITTITATDLSALSAKSISNWESRTAKIKSTIAFEKKNGNATAATAESFLAPLQNRLALLAQAFADKTARARDSSAINRLRQVATSGKDEPGTNADVERVARMNETAEKDQQAALAAKQTEKDQKEAGKTAAQAQAALSQLQKDSLSMGALKREYDDLQDKLEEILEQKAELEVTAPTSAGVARLTRRAERVEELKQEGEQKMKILAEEMQQRAATVKKAGIPFDETDFNMKPWIKAGRDVLTEIDVASKPRPESRTGEATQAGQQAAKEKMKENARAEKSKLKKEYNKVNTLMDELNEKIKSINNQKEEIVTNSPGNQMLSPAVQAKLKSLNESGQEYVKAMENNDKVAKNLFERIQKLADVLKDDMVDDGEPPVLPPSEATKLSDIGVRAPGDDSMKPVEEVEKDNIALASDEDKAEEEAIVAVQDAKATLDNLTEYKPNFLKEMATQFTSTTANDPKEFPQAFLTYLSTKKDYIDFYNFLLEQAEKARTLSGKIKNDQAELKARGSKVTLPNDINVAAFSKLAQSMPLKIRAASPPANPSKMAIEEPKGDSKKRGTADSDSAAKKKRKDDPDATKPSKSRPKPAKPVLEALEDDDKEVGSGDRVVTSGKLNTAAAAVVPDKSSDFMLYKTKRKRTEPAPEEEEEEEQQQQQGQKQDEVAMETPQDAAAAAQRLPGVQAPPAFGVQNDQNQAMNFTGSGNAKKKTKFAVLERKLQQI